ncbi:MAG: hypothetical protein WC979_02600 [Candidatus Pacearchaeota archaeon]|jgi:hypothetical protein|nr:hypothetical protein [Clostridia bacterium]
MKNRIPAFDDFIVEREFPFTDTSFVTRILTKLKSQILEKNLGNLEVETILNKAFRSFLVSFESNSGQSAFDDMTRVGLIQSRIDQDGNIIVDYADYFYETFEDEELYDEFGTVLARILAHERTHAGQLDKIRMGRNSYDFYNILGKIGKDPSNRFKYLSSKQEMMAFAVECVEEFRGMGYSDSDILRKIKTPFKDYQESNIFYLYIDYFDYRGHVFDNDEKERKKCKDVIDGFLKYMYQYITKPKSLE